MDKEQQRQTNKDASRDLKLRTSGWELVQPWHGREG